MPEDLVEEALALYRVRNRKLGHSSGTPLTADELTVWIDVAERVALGFIGAYAQRLAP